MTVITMTREMGSLGRDVARGVAERLGLEVIHNEVVEHHVAERLNVGESLVHRFLEGEASLADKLRVQPRALAFCTAEEIFDLAERGNVLIRGWGATQLLRPVSHVICLRVCAPLGVRVEAMARRLDTGDRRFLVKEIRQSDAAHRKVARRFSRHSWRDPALYDLVLNTERVSIDRGVDLVSALAGDEAFRETSASRAALALLKQQAGEFRRANPGSGVPQAINPAGHRQGSRAGRGAHVPEDYATSREERDLLL